MGILGISNFNPVGCGTGGSTASLAACGQNGFCTSVEGGSAFDPSDVAWRWVCLCRADVEKFRVPGRFFSFFRICCSQPAIAKYRPGPSIEPSHANQDGSIPLA